MAYDERINVPAIDLPVGTRFRFNGVSLEVVDSGFDCSSCYFFKHPGSVCGGYASLLLCLRSVRRDGKFVIFKKL